VCLEALLKVRGDAYITLRGDGKALEKIDVFHDCTLAYSGERRLRRPDAPERCFMPTYRGTEKMPCHPKLWSFHSG
jgi:hypothetical protein